MSLSAPFIRRPIGTSLLALGVLVAGMICYALLGVAALPNVEFPAIFVSASQPGADAGTMASTVASPLERHLGRIAGVDDMMSNSSEGNAVVNIVFDVSRDLDSIARDVQAAINAAAPDLPSGLRTAPTYRKANPSSQPVLILALTSPTRSLGELYNTADSLIAQRIRQLPGVADADIAGGATPAVRVDLDLRALAARGLSAATVRSALVAANVTTAQGFLSNGQTTMAIASDSAMRTAEEFAALIIASHDGRPVYLRDVATVAAGQEDRYQAAWFNGQRAILILVRKQPDANVIATVDAIMALLPELRTWLPSGAELTPFSDRTPTIRASVREVQVALLISLGLVVLTMGLFLRRLAPTLIAGITVPLSLAGAFAVMYALGFTLNNFSLMALVIAIGFVVDDAIVVIENIARHIDAGMSRMEATLLGAREIGFTIVSITLSLLAVFIPLVFMGGFLGMMIREFAITLAAAIALSAVVALTVTPSLCAQFMGGLHGPSQRSLGRRLDRFHAGMQSTYARALDWALRHPRQMALQPVLLLAMSLWLMSIVPKGFLPQQDTGQLQGSTDAGSDVSFQVLVERQQRIADLVRADPAVESVGVRVGGGRFGGGGGSGNLFINLKPLGEGRNESTFAVMGRLSRKAAEVAGIRLRLRPVQDIGGGGGGGGGGGAQYEFSLKGADLATLQEWTPRIVEALRKQPQFKDVDSNLQGAGLRQNIQIDRDAAARLGVSIAAIDSALYDAFGQRQVSTIYSDVNQYKVVVTARPDQAATPAALERLYVRASNGSMIPLATLAAIRPGIAPTTVQHRNQFPVMEVSFNLADGVAMSDASRLVEETVRALRMPGDIRAEFGGDFRRFQQQTGDTPLLLIAAVIAVYLILGMLYESLIHPLTILSTLPSAGVGALLALLVTGTELSVVSVIAIVLLIGIVKKNAIMMIDFALAAERERGMEPLAAIREACLVRFRPIMMTSIVAIFSALPLAIGFGAGAEMRRPLGIAMIGGLLVSQALTLLTTPAIYLLLARRTPRHRQRAQAAGA
ncbi:efflux RND transporter permease subunit [Tahibacter amnicola]|uniref:Efflux RND transporter permease subunit n=1 Tax=Tahibacter amnicola TaxID=2976241 RepID=A0ABY6BC62_9GAMM|nr:efflux RND transporter permease subunit [Tahibacter amnicola]UXI67454.1 efflux RND transporter permease subunit [Tahibacter amnicola]